MQISALSSVQHTAPAKPAIPAPVMKKIDESAKSFESMFMSQMMQFMWAGGNEADETFGGGHGETMWRGMLVQEFGKISTEGRGMGLADSVRDQMIRLTQAQMMPVNDVAANTEIHTQAPTKESAQ